MKTCTKCGLAKSLEAFHPRSDQPGKYRSHCKACANRKNREWNADNYEKRKPVVARWQAANQDLIKEKAKEWQARHPEKVSAKGKRWYYSNQEKKLAYRRQWTKENPEKNREQVRRYHARKKGAAVVENVSLDELYDRDGGKCHICHGKVQRPEASMDHLVPLSQGGDHSWANVALAHMVCNSRRGPGRIPAQLRLV